MRSRHFLLHVFTLILLLKRCTCIQQQQSYNAKSRNTSPLSFHNNLPQSLVPLWKKNIWMNLYIFINSEYQFTDYQGMPDWKLSIQNNNQDFQLKKHMDLIIPKNAMLYAHIFLVKDSFPIDPTNKSFSTDSIVYVCHALTKFYHDENHPYWHNTITISLVHDSSNYISKDTLHPVTLKYFLNNQKKQQQQQQQGVAFYRPIVFPNDFWLIKKDAYPINDTTSVLPLTINLESINVWKFNVYAVLASSKVDETKKKMMMDPSYILCMTLITCLFHGLFEFLAFKNDISFWVNKKNGIGVSINSIIINMMIQTISFIYFVDSTNVLRGVMQLVRISIEVWKLHRVFGYEYDWTLIQQPRFMIKVEVQQHTNGTMIEGGEKRTRCLDATALHYLFYIVVPLFIAYYYWEGSTFVSALVEFLSLFGWILVTVPQLYINYQMQMVNHISVHTLTYKSISIAIDDLFALGIGMPIINRLSCAKDNIIFLAYILQRTRFINKIINHFSTRKPQVVSKS